MPFATKAIRDRQRKRVAARVRAGEPCCLCGLAVDLSIPWPDPRSFTVEHRTPTSKGGADHGEAQLAPAHLGCNARRGNGPTGSLGRNSGLLEAGR